MKCARKECKHQAKAGTIFCSSTCGDLCVMSMMIDEAQAIRKAEDEERAARFSCPADECQITPPEMDAAGCVTCFEGGRRNKTWPCPECGRESEGFPDDLPKKSIDFPI